MSHNSKTRNVQSGRDVPGATLSRIFVAEWQESTIKT